jgi:phosphopantetheine adenylyltransferase
VTTGEPQTRQILVIANETLVGDELVEAVRRHAQQGPTRVMVVAPVNEPRSGYVVYEDSRRAAAGRRLDRILARLREAGIPAHGSVYEAGPLDAVRDTLAQESIDEVIVSTHPESKSGWLRRNLVDEIRRAAGGRPVEHVIADVAEQTGSANVLVIANQTLLGDPLLDRIRTRAREGKVGFLIVSPQSDPAAGPHPEAERRLRTALSTLRAEGIEAHGQIAHPDPFTAAMNVVEDERVDEIIVSTFPGERSGWLRRDLVGRLRTAVGVPVEHVISDLPRSREEAPMGQS